MYIPKLWSCQGKKLFAHRAIKSSMEVRTFRTYLTQVTRRYLGGEPLHTYLVLPHKSERTSLYKTIVMLTNFTITFYCRGLTMD